MGLRCKRVRHRCWRYLDGTLSARERAWVERHLVGCGECRAVFAQAASILEMLQKGLPIGSDSLPSLPRHLRRYLLPKEKPDGWRWSVMLPLLVALIGLVGGMGLVRFVPTDSRPPLTSSQAKPISPKPTSRLEAGEAHGGILRDLGVPPPPLQSGDTPRPKRLQARPLSKGTAPQDASRARRLKSSSPKRIASPRRQMVRPSQSQPPLQTPPPEGTVEVYDPSGQLVKRDRVRGNR